MKRGILAKIIAITLLLGGVLGLMFLAFQGLQTRQAAQEQTATQASSEPSVEVRPTEPDLAAVSEEQIVRIADSETDFALKGDKNSKKTNQLPQVTDGRVLAQSRFDFAAIRQGDFSSLAGTWQDGYGNLLVLDEKGTITDGLTLQMEAAQYGMMPGSYGGEDGLSSHVELIPAGIDASLSITDAYTLYDASDVSLDRIWIGDSWASLTDPNIYYYRLDDEVSQDESTSES